MKRSRKRCEEDLRRATDAHICLSMKHPKKAQAQYVQFLSQHLPLTTDILNIIYTLVFDINELLDTLVSTIPKRKTERETKDRWLKMALHYLHYPLLKKVYELPLSKDEMLPSLNVFWSKALENRLHPSCSQRQRENAEQIMSYVMSSPADPEILLTHLDLLIKREAQLVVVCRSIKNEDAFAHPIIFENMNAIMVYQELHEIRNWRHTLETYLSQIM